MIGIELKIWAVHIYVDGNYHRTVDVALTEREAETFCKTFNACSCGRLGERWRIVAVAKACAARAEADRGE